MRKTIIVTGASKRIGAEICRQLHAAGYNIVIHYRASSHDAFMLRDQLNALRDNSADVYSLDLKDITSLPEIVQFACRRFGRLDGLVNNASIFFPTQLDQIDLDNWDELINTNVKAPVFLAKAAADELRRNGGAIVNITDIHANQPMRGHLIYNISKSALLAATRSLARELGPLVRVNAVAPGANIWPEDTSFIDQEARERITSSTILNRPGQPGDIAETVCFLISQASYITGQMIAVDGGRSIVLSD